MFRVHHAPSDYICPFCLIAKGGEGDRVLTLQADVVYRDKFTTAFVSSHQYPNNSGHVLVIPNDHFENLYELPDELGAKIHATSRMAALAIKEAYGCDGVSTRQHNEPAGHQDVWHYHLHVFPRYAEDGLYGATSSLMPSEQRAQWAERLRAAWPM